MNQVILNKSIMASTDEVGTSRYSCPCPVDKESLLYNKNPILDSSVRAPNRNLLSLTLSPSFTQYVYVLTMAIIAGTT